MNAADERHMRRALVLAARAAGRTAPNPMVGCVIVKGARVVAEGLHRKAGTPHAEVAALASLSAQAAQKAPTARGSTVYVTLEPCNHHGRTGPCSEALIAAGVSRVVVAMLDPNPNVTGGGVERLRSAGIRVDVGACEDEARRLNAGFVSLVTTGRPRVTLKAAVTLDGRLAASSGDSRWVTGEAARRQAHRLRDQADAILVGAGTVKTDDPSLTTRLGSATSQQRGRRGRDALRVILDGKLSISPNANVVGPGTLIVTTTSHGRARIAPFIERGAEVLSLAGSRGRVDLGALLDELGRRGVLELLVEGGGEVHGAFLTGGLTEGLVDRVIAFVAPKLVGAGGVPMIAAAGAPSMAGAWSLANVTVRRLGDDVMITGELARPPRPPRSVPPRRARSG